MDSANQATALGSPLHRRKTRAVASGDIPPSAAEAMVPQMDEKESIPAAPLGSPIGVAHDSERAEPELLNRINEIEKDDDVAAAASQERVFSPVPDFRIPAILATTTASLAILAIIGLVGLYVFAQTLTILDHISGLPDRTQWLAYGVMVLLVLCVAAALAKLGWAFLRLQTTRRIALKGIGELQDRARGRQEVELDANAARNHLRDHLQNFPLSHLVAFGATDQQLKALANSRTKLLDPENDLGAVDWLRDFKAGFQQALDEVAAARINRHALRVGVRVAASPFVWVDTLVVLHGAASLVGDLSRIYQVRLGTGSTVLVAAWAGFQSVMAGKIEELSTTELEQTSHDIHSQFVTGDHTGALDQIGTDLVDGGVETASALARNVGTHILAGVTQGVLQGLLLKRLGRRVQRWLRMVE